MTFKLALSRMAAFSLVLSMAGCMPLTEAAFTPLADSTPALAGLGQNTPVRGYNQPFERAMREASTRLAAPSLPMASDR